jgi:NADPH:quinone reductase-like Zn-dependent oxidoreductase
VKAARRDSYGPPDVIRVEEIPVPIPGDDELLVRVHAATVSRTDCALLSAIPFLMRALTGLATPRNRTLGTDFAGVVEAVGAGVSELRVGDRVWGMNDLGAGSHAEYLTIKKDASVTRMPEGVGFAEAVGCLEGGWYAYSIVERTGIVRGTRVLINGATGAIGVAALQLCVHAGATVTAVGNTKNLDLLRSLGASRVIDYEHEDFTDDPGEYDRVIDAVGKSTFGRCKRLLAPRGVYASTDLGPGWQNVFLPLVTPRGKKRAMMPIPVNRNRFLAAAGPLVAEGHLRAVIDRRYSLDEVRDAYEYARSGRKTGCVILAIAP